MEQHAETGLERLERMDQPGKLRASAQAAARALAGMEAMTHALAEVTVKYEELEKRFEAFVRDEHLPLRERIDTLERRMMGRNKSSAVNRDMTDEDAVEVLLGKYKDMSHKTAEAASGLTYAQIYSCRLEYTFKHVHKRLRESGFKNPWARK